MTPPNGVQKSEGVESAMVRCTCGCGAWGDAAFHYTKDQGSMDMDGMHMYGPRMRLWTEMETYPHRARYGAQ